MASCLEELGHEVVVADPNFAAMYGTRTRRIKTDRRDVAALAGANRTGVPSSLLRRALLVALACMTGSSGSTLRAATSGPGIWVEIQAGWGADRGPGDQVPLYLTAETE